ncbi:MAG: response regulator [Desulfovibrio sp.]|nr:response regulator [Desulfovibrio sp.]
MTMRVLLADDERDFVDTLAERLSLRGYEVTTVHNGAEAVRAATSARPDVAVLDLFMPGLPGDETLRQLKVMYPDLPVILLTGHEAVDDNGTSPVAKAFACLTKPLAFKDFVAVLEAAARAGRQASEGGEDGQ